MGIYLLMVCLNIERILSLSRISFLADFCFKRVEEWMSGGVRADRAP